MRDLISQAKDPEQIKRRGHQVKLVRFRSGKIGIRYVAPNGKVFFIDPNGYPYGDPIIWSKWPLDIRLKSGHATHYYGDGHCCIGGNLNKLELYQILYMIDAWARGLELYLSGRSFPSTPEEAFGLKRRGKSRGIWSFLGL